MLGGILNAGTQKMLEDFLVKRKYVNQHISPL